MLALLEVPALRARVVAGGTKTIAERFDPDQLAAQVVTVYNSVRAAVSGKYHTS
jgi:hypothetical protein